MATLVLRLTICQDTDSTAGLLGNPGGGGRVIGLRCAPGPFVQPGRIVQAKVWLYATLWHLRSCRQSSLNFVSLIGACGRCSKARFPLARLGFTTSTPSPIEPPIPAGTSVDQNSKMSGRYAFSNGLKELRFLFCQTGEQSSATRCVVPFGFGSVELNQMLIHVRRAGPSSREPTRS